MGKFKYVRLLIALLLIITFAVPIRGEDTAEQARLNTCEGPGALGIILDTILVRPLGLASMVIGFAGAIVAYPFAFASGSADRVTQKLIYEPFAFTFLRPVGELDYDGCRK
jgi:hypothetical protein